MMHVCDRDYFDLQIEIIVLFNFAKIEYVNEKLIEHGLSAWRVEHVAESHGQIENEKEEIQKKNDQAKAYVELAFQIKRFH